MDYLVGAHYKHEQYVKEFNRLYQIQPDDEEMMEIVDYLKQNPKFKKSLHTHTTLNGKTRKTIEEKFRVYVKDNSK